jgi:O-methyltransferase
MRILWSDFKGKSIDSMSFRERFKRSLKKILAALQRVLPASVFNPLLRLIMTVYRFFIRTAYLVRTIPRFFRKDPQGWETARQVYRALPYSLVGVGGLEATYRLTRDAVKQGLPGDFVELGVARGGCAALMGSAIFDGADKEGSRLWLFDSFEGLPPPGELDYEESVTCETGDHIRPLDEGSCLGTLNEVEHLLFDTYRFPRERIALVKGWFEDTIPRVGKEIDGIAVLRIDADWYDSTKICLDHFYDKVTPGGAVIIDDYETCHGCKKALDTFLSERGLKANLESDGRGGRWFVKSDEL